MIWNITHILLSISSSFSSAIAGGGLSLQNPPNFLDFDNIGNGAITTIGNDNDITIRAFKEPRVVWPDRLLPALAIVFDSANPGDASRQIHLGSPNESFGGPGVGTGGAMGSPYANDRARGKLLVISSNEDTLKPDANLYGGELEIKFRVPTNIDSMGIIMAYYRTSVEVITDTGRRHVVEFYAKHYNSYWLVPIKIPNVVQLVYRPQSISGITHINFKPEPDKCPVSKLLDFASFKSGNMLSTLPDGAAVWTIKAKSNERRPAMILDTFRTNDPDFGSPHNSVGGPGYGQDGRLGMPFENVKKQGNALIVSVDQNSANPSPTRSGGTIVFTFKERVYIASIGLLNNVQGASISAKTWYIPGEASYTEEYHTNVGGRNSFQEVFLWAPNTSELTIQFDGPGALTFIKLGTCK